MYSIFIVTSKLLFGYIIIIIISMFLITYIHDYKMYHHYEDNKQIDLKTKDLIDEIEKKEEKTEEKNVVTKKDAPKKSKKKIEAKKEVKIKKTKAKKKEIKKVTKKTAKKTVKKK